MAAQITTWEQTGIYDPSNPDQRSYTRYVGIPGGYGTFYVNKVPTSAKLLGVLDSAPSWLTSLIVLGLGVGAGFLGAKHAGPRIKRAFKR